MSRLPGDSACFEVLRKGGAQLRRLVSHFYPRLCYSVPTPPPLLLCKLRTWLTGQWCCCTKALVARRCNWRDAEQVEQRAGCYLQVHRFLGTRALCHPPPFSANGKTPASCRASSWEKAYMFQNSWGTESFATLLFPIALACESFPNLSKLPTCRALPECLALLSNKAVTLISLASISLHINCKYMTLTAGLLPQPLPFLFSFSIATYL